MAIITISNFYKLINKIDISKAEISLKDVFGATRSFFSEDDLKILAIAIEIIQNPSKLEKFKNCMKKEDTYTYVYEMASPAHHVGKDCDRLWRIFPNWEILHNGERAGQEKVERIRELNFKYPGLIKDETKFAEKILKVVGAGITLEPISFKRKGITSFSVDSITEIADKINDKIRESKEHCGSQKEYDNNYTQALKDLLVEYHMARYNPKLDFDKDLLENFGFVPCQRCSNGIKYFEMMLMKKAVEKIKKEGDHSRVKFRQPS